VENPFTYLTDLINTMGNPALFWAAAGLFAFLLALWLIHRIVKSAVRSAIRESGLVVSQPHMVRSRRPTAVENDFVYTEPRSEQ
jgi:hypothetical protein